MFYKHVAFLWEYQRQIVTKSRPFTISRFYRFYRPCLYREKREKKFCFLDREKSINPKYSTYNLTPVNLLIANGHIIFQYCETVHLVSVVLVWC